MHSFISLCSLSICHSGVPTKLALDEGFAAVCRPSTLVPEKENICENVIKAVSKMASGMSFQGASHFTVNFNIKS